MATAQKLCCQVEGIIRHGEHVYTVDLRPQRLAPRFRPGQFLHLALDPYDPSGFWPESRVFSIASSPEQRDQLRIVYSVRGRFTARMEQELAEGKSIWVKLPYGDFVVQGSQDVALFAGGTGITAFTAFLEGLSPDLSHQVYLAYGARSQALLIYRDMLQQRARACPALHVSCWIEQSNGELAPDTTVGRLSIESLWPRLRDPAQTTFYLSGPPPMLKTLAHDLRTRGIKPEAIRIDAWE